MSMVSKQQVDTGDGAVARGPVGRENMHKRVRARPGRHTRGRSVRARMRIGEVADREPAGDDTHHAMMRWQLTDLSGIRPTVTAVRGVLTPHRHCMRRWSCTHLTILPLRMLAPGMRSGVARPLATQRIATDDSIERLRDAMRNLSRRIMHGVMHRSHPRREHT